MKLKKENITTVELINHHKCKKNFIKNKSTFKIKQPIFRCQTFILIQSSYSSNNGKTT